MPAAPAASKFTPLYEYGPESCARAGVGSNGSQPQPGNQASTHACASWSVTVRVVLSFDRSPLVKPTATRAGIPR